MNQNSQQHQQPSGSGMKNQRSTEDQASDALEQPTAYTQIDDVQPEEVVMGTITDPHNSKSIATHAPGTSGGPSMPPTTAKKHHLSKQTVSDQYNSLNTTNMPQTSQKDGAEMSQFQNLQSTSEDNGGQQYNHHSQSRGRTSGPQIDPSFVNEGIQQMDNNLAILTTHQNMTSPSDAFSGPQIAGTGPGTLRSNHRHSSIPNHNQVFTPQVGQRHQNSFMDRRAPGQLQQQQQWQQMNNTAKYVNIYGPEAFESQQYGFGSGHTTRGTVQTKRHNMTHMRNKVDHAPQNFPMDLANTMSPMGGNMGSLLGSTRNGVGSVAGTAGRERDVMSAEYQNFLNMTQPTPNEPDWGSLHHNQLFSRAEQKRNGSMNLSQDLLNNFASRNLVQVPPMSGSNNTRFGKRLLEPLANPPPIMSRGAHNRPNYDNLGYTFVQWVDQSPGGLSRKSQPAMPISEQNKNNLAVQNMSSIAGPQQVSRAPNFDRSICDSFLSQEEEQLLNDLRMYRQIKIKTANIIPERQLKYAQEREIHRRQLQQMQGRRRHQRQGTADQQRKDANHNHFEREQDKFQQMRKRICQSQKGGMRSLHQARGQTQPISIRNSLDGSLEGIGKGVGDSTTNDYTQHPHPHEGSIIPQQHSPDKMVHQKHAQGYPVKSVQEDSINAFIDSAATSLRVPDPIAKEQPTMNKPTSPKTLKPFAPSIVDPAITSPTSKSQKKSQSRERTQKQEETQVEARAAEEHEARKQKETEREMRLRKKAERTAIKEEAKRIRKERRDKFEQLMKKSVQMLKKVKELKGKDGDEDDDGGADLKNLRTSQQPSLSMPPNQSSTTPKRQQIGKYSQQTTSNDRNFHGPPFGKKPTQLFNQQQLSLQPIYSTTKPSPSSKSTINQKERDFKNSPTGPNLSILPGLKLIDNIDIYKQVAQRPSRAPEILFGSLKHNLIIYKEQKNLMKARKQNQLNNEPTLSNMRKGNAFTSQMSVNSGALNQSSKNDDYGNVNINQKEILANRVLKVPFDKHSNTEFSNKLQVMRIHSSISMRSMSSGSPQHHHRTSKPTQSPFNYQDRSTDQNKLTIHQVNTGGTHSLSAASPHRLDGQSINIEEQQRDDDNNADLEMNLEEQEEQYDDDDELDRMGTGASQEESRSGEGNQNAKKVQFGKRNEVKVVKPQYEGPVRWHFSMETMKEFNLEYEDIKVKIPSVSPQKIVNHVVVNRQTVQNYQYIREINFYQNLLKSAHNREQAKKTLELINEAQRLQKIENLNKWDDFRVRRTEVMNTYLETKRRSMSIRALLIIASVHSALKMILFSIREEKRNRVMKYNAAKISLLLYVKMKRQITKHGGIVKLNHNRLRDTLTLGGNTLYHKALDCDIKKVMEQFLIKTLFIKELKLKGRLFHRKIKWVKRRFIDQFTTKDDKLKVIKRLWDKTINDLEIEANLNGNPRMKTLVFELKYRVPASLKTAVLKEYIKRCTQKYKIAFFQWRYMYHYNGGCNDDSGQRDTTMIKQSMKDMSKRILNSIDISRQPKDKTKTKAFIDPKDEKDYENVLGDPYEEFEKNPYMIVSFWQVGMADPFPDGQTQDFSDQSIIKNSGEISLTDLVYPAYRYVDGQIPIMMFIPGKHMLFKMMRACLACKSENDLWFNVHFGHADCSSSHSEGPIDFDAIPKKELKNITDSEGTPLFRKEDRSPIYSNADEEMNMDI